MSEYTAIPAFGKFPIWWRPWQHTHKGSESRGSIPSGVEHNASQTLAAQQTEQRGHHSEERSGTQAPANTYLSGACVPGSGPGSGGSAMVQAGQPGTWDKPQTQPSLCESNPPDPSPAGEASDSTGASVSSMRRQRKQLAHCVKGGNRLKYVVHSGKPTDVTGGRGVSPD